MASVKDIEIKYCMTIKQAKHIISLGNIIASPVQYEHATELLEELESEDN